MQFVPFMAAILIYSLTHGNRANLNLLSKAKKDESEPDTDFLYIQEKKLSELRSDILRNLQAYRTSPSRPIMALK